MLSSVLSFGFGSETFEFPAILDDNFDSRLARLLDKAGVPNFTWGYKHLFDNGSMNARYDDTSDWAIPDDSLPKAKEVLDKAGFPPCKGPNCFLYWEQLKFPIPDVHYHTELRYDEIPPEGTLSLQGGSLGREPGGIYLYKMSRIFLRRFFPDPPIGAPPRNDSYYTLANRAGESSYPVKRLIAARYVEAIVLLSLRDLRSGVETSNHWNDHLSFMLRHGNGIIGECLTFDDIKEPYREYLKRRVSHRYASQKDDLGGGEAFLYEQWLEMTRARILPPPERSRWKRKNGMFSLERMLKKYNIPYDESDLALEYI